MRQKGTVKRKFPTGLRHYLSLLPFLVLIFALGCKTQRSAIKAPIKEYGADFLLEKLQQNELKFEWLSARMRISYTNDKSTTDFKGQLRVRKDSVIWFSFSPALGIEMARLIITQDSIKYLNRLDKVYFKGDYDFVNRFLETNIDFDILQSFIIANDFQFYDKSTFRASIDHSEYKLSTTDRRKLLKYVEETGIDDKLVLIQNIWLNPESFKISRVDIKEYGKENKKLEAYYKSFDQVNDQWFPSRTEYKITGDQKLQIDVAYSRIELEEPMRFPFSISPRYERIQ
jgi:hypothetical protein